MHPKLARYRESGLKATHLIPKVCSVRIASGMSEEASFAIEKIKTLGLYPVCAKEMKVSTFLVTIL
jgi:hypothetical protein